MSMSRITLYIPSEHEKSAHYVEQALAGFASIAGGASSASITGAWQPPNQALCTEPLSVVYSLASDATLPACKTFALRLAQDIKSAMSQEAVLVTIEPHIDMILV